MKSRWKKITEGKLNCYSMQGFEGGYLSVQDKRFIHFEWGEGGEKQGKPYESWDPMGQHILEDKDILKVIDPISKKIICEAQVNKIPLRIFTAKEKDHFTKIKKKNEHWKKYFDERYEAELYRKEERFNKICSEECIFMLIISGMIAAFIFFLSLCS